MSNTKLWCRKVFAAEQKKKRAKEIIFKKQKFRQKKKNQN